MSFVAHAQAHGLIINHAIPDGRWHRVPTVDKPRKRNGAYIFDGNSGVVKNWATMESFARYGEKVSQFIKYFDDSEERIKHARAAKQAQELINKATMATHPYLKAKGFPDAKGLVIGEELIVPMRDINTQRVVGAQRIQVSGEKRFIPGTRAKGAVFVLGRGRDPWLVEGYATGLSVQAALRFSDVRVVVCFSAGNLAHVARITGGRIVADHDASGTGQRVAKASGLPWCMSPNLGEDANDLHMRSGLGAVRSMLRECVIG
jgi:putative DNA primase/helicase